VTYNIDAHSSKVTLKTDSPDFKYQGFRYPVSSQQLTFEFENLTNALLKVSGLFSFESPYAYNHTITQKTECSAIELKDSEPDFFHCLNPKLTYGFMYNSDYMNSAMAHHSLIIRKENLQYAKAFEGGAEIDFYPQGQVAQIRCIYAGPEYYSSYVNNKATIFSNMAPGYHLGGVSAGQIFCRRPGQIFDFKEDGTPKKGILNGFVIISDKAPTNNDGPRYLFGFGGGQEYLKLQCFDTNLLIYDAPIYETFPNGQIKAAVYGGKGSTDPRPRFLTDTMGQPVLIDVGDVIRFNEDGSVNQISENYCDRH
jgi:hypothetical protein